ncbi:MAG TPA: LuxR C-terminal-related transcriptional regulator [Candidatus Polarisedimenticolia bacterium]|nr:LuxR C-terminal-related transcriptional regulator [Candidatus Polarisedimenticolia bacterium]
MQLDLGSRCGECLLFGAIQGLEDGLVLVDPEGRIFHINRRAQELLRIDATAVGKPFRSTVAAASVARFWNSASRRRESASTEIVLSAGSLTRATIACCYSHAGGLIGRALLLRDITREKRIQVDLPVEVARRLVDIAGAPGPDPSLLLTRREREVLELLAGGMTNTAIARRLKVAPNTVASHLKRLYAKLGARNRSQAVAYALSHGMTSRR